ncbi:MAG TPA: hypothetical protein VGG68_06430, partial [Caulobacteraceae bacterium]
MADPIDLALDELENEPLPTSTRDRTAQESHEDDIEVTYADEDGQAATSEPQEREKPPENREIEPQEGIEELRARLQASDSARRQAEERANQAEHARAQATGATQDANVQFLTTALEGVKQTLGVLQANLAEAYATQDFNQAAQIQTEISRTTQRETLIENGLEQLKTAPREQPRAPPPPEDQVEAIAGRLTPNAAAWVRAHPNYITDTRLNERLVSAHHVAIAAGLVADSPDYITHVERTLGLAGQSSPRPGFTEERNSVPETRRTAPSAAPVSRGANG